VNTNGGIGGNGGRGQKLINPCVEIQYKGYEHKFGTQGDQGPKGTDGIWRFQQICN
jgi:hypothetical protein